MQRRYQYLTLYPQHVMIVTLDIIQDSSDNVVLHAPWTLPLLVSSKRPAYGIYLDS
jgi:hypothetical protein